MRVPFETADGSAKNGKDYDETKEELLFEEGVTEKDILINIIDGEEYQKNKTFTVSLGTPQVPQSEKEYHEQLKTANGKLSRKKSVKFGAPYVTDKARVQKNIRGELPDRIFFSLSFIDFKFTTDVIYLQTL